MDLIKERAIVGRIVQKRDIKKKAHLVIATKERGAPGGPKSKLNTNKCKMT